MSGVVSAVIVTIAEVVAVAVGTAAVAMGAGGAALGIIGTAVTGIVSGALTGALVGAVVGGVMSAATGGDIGKGIMMGAMGGAITGGVMGGVGAFMGGAETLASGAESVGSGAGDVAGGVVDTTANAGNLVSAGAENAAGWVPPDFAGVGATPQGEALLTAGVGGGGAPSTTVTGAAQGADQASANLTANADKAAVDLTKTPTAGTNQTVAPPKDSGGIFGMSEKTSNTLLEGTIKGGVDFLKGGLSPDPSDNARLQNQGAIDLLNRKAELSATTPVSGYNSAAPTGMDPNGSPSAAQFNTVRSSRAGMSATKLPSMSVYRTGVANA